MAQFYTDNCTAVATQELGNVRVVKHDVSVLLKEHMQGEAFTEAYILFPVTVRQQYYSWPKRHTCNSR